MSEIDKEKQYFQEIARRFIFWTGRGPFLSPKDIDLINQWRKKNIPLKVVLEGINRTFEDYRFSAKRRKIKSLYFCNRQVLKAYHHHLDRKVGLIRRKVNQDKRKNMALEEINQFLNNLPEELRYLSSLYKKALPLIKKGEEEELENLDNQVELLLYEKHTEKKGALKKGDDELSRKKLIKELRKKYKIPYLSLFYY